MQDVSELDATVVHDHRGRLARVCRELVQNGLEIGVLFDPEDIFWLTGYQSIGYFTFQCLAIERTGRVHLVSRKVNDGLAGSCEFIDEFVAIEDTEDPVDVLAGFLGARNGESGKVGCQTDSWYLTVDQHQRLATSLKSLQAEPWNDGVKPQRIVKSDAEIALIRAAGRTAIAALDAAVEEVRPGCTENDIAAAMHSAGIRAGSEYLGHPPLVVTGARTALCFATWQRHQVRHGDVVLLEAAGCIDRYHAMVSRSVVVGQPTAGQRKVADTILSVLATAIDAIRPGVKAGDVDSAARAHAVDAGLGQYFAHRVGYGIGIGFPPNWSEGHIYAIRPGSDLVLQPNMTFHIVPTLFTPEFGMCFSESVRVTETGCEVLTPCDRGLRIRDT